MLKLAESFDKLFAVTEVIEPFVMALNILKFCITKTQRQLIVMQVSVASGGGGAITPSHPQWVSISLAVTAHSR